MPRRVQPKTTDVDLPLPGTIFTFSLADGRFGAARVLRVDIPEHSVTRYALVILTEYIGSTLPRLDDPALRKPLLLNHHSWSNSPDLFWAIDPVPSDFQVLGVIPLNSEEATTDSGTYGSVEALPWQRLTQWRWEHDRNALLAEEEIEKAEQEKKLAAEAERRARILANTTLPKIRKRKSLFPHWQGHVPAGTTRAIEQSIRAFIDAVIAMKNPTRRDITRELRICAKALNKLDAQQGHPIATIEREDIFELFEEILTVAKQPDLIEKLGEWRDW